MEKEYTRFKLYEIVWSKPMVALAKKYFISDTWVRKQCTRMNIPNIGIGKKYTIFYRNDLIRAVSNFHKAFLKRIDIVNRLTAK